MKILYLFEKSSFVASDKNDKCYVLPFLKLAKGIGVPLALQVK
jgi:hypothetical protein